LGSAVAAGDQVALCEGGTMLAVGEVRRVGKQGQERMAVQPRSVLEGA